MDFAARRSLADVLGTYPPFDSLSTAELHSLATTAHIVDFDPGAEVMNGFAHDIDELSVILSGQVELWNTVLPAPDGPDDVFGPGGVFGYSSMLTRERKGPRAIAVGPVRLCQIPAEDVQPIFSGLAGARFLAGKLSVTRRRITDVTAGHGTVDELITFRPVVIAPDTTVGEAAQRMTRSGVHYVVVDAGDGEFGVLTDGDIRARLVAAGLGGDVAVRQVMTYPALTVRMDAPATDALTLIVEHQLSCVPVTDPGGALRGVVIPADFIAAPSGPSINLRRQIAEATTVAELQDRARRMPYLVGDLVRRGLLAHEICRVLSLVNDAVVRRALELSLADRPDLDSTALTWLSLGSNARREPVLSSDIDSAVSLRDGMSTEEIAAYRSVFGAVDDVLRGAGLTVDNNGAIASMPLFTRTHSQWRAAAQTWLGAPLENKGMIFTSLLLDGRPIWGDQGLTAVAEVFADLRNHQGTLKLLLAESLSTKARLHSVRDVLVRRGGTFNIKQHALTPLINIARWGALSVGSTELDTRSRLRDAADSPMLTPDSVSTLDEVFDVLQKVRLTYQLEQLERREDPSDVITMRRISPLDRSLIAQAVREIAAVQRRMANASYYAPVTSAGE
ncbi:MAG: putative nucleotidyltransferase substrate binding domain-containing protein [Gordonia sp. (in: high G+C Gram-positive bacteria)]